MAKKKREVQEINASSMADISFLLLIFFLVTTTMATDKGLARKLPAPVPPDEQTQEEDININRRNIMQVLINSNDQLMVDGELLPINRLKEKAKEFIANPNNSEKLPAKKVEEIPFFGNIAITKEHVISLQNDRGTSYQAYIGVQNELVAAYGELREELSRSKFGTSYAELDEDHQKAVQQVYPQRVSEAEPKDYSKISGGAQ